MHMSGMPYSQLPPQQPRSSSSPPEPPANRRRLGIRRPAFSPRRSSTSPIRRPAQEIAPGSPDSRWGSSCAVTTGLQAPVALPVTSPLVALPVMAVPVSLDHDHGQFSHPQEQLHMPQGQLYIPQEEFPQEWFSLPQEQLCMPQEQLFPQEQFFLPQGQLFLPQGQLHLPQEQLPLLQEEEELPQEQLPLPWGQLHLPQGQLQLPQGQLHLPQGPLPLAEPAIPLEPNRTVRRSCRHSRRRSMPCLWPKVLDQTIGQATSDKVCRIPGPEPVITRDPVRLQQMMDILPDRFFGHFSMPMNHPALSPAADPVEARNCGH